MKLTVVVDSLTVAHVAESLLADSPNENVTATATIAIRRPAPKSELIRPSKT